MYVYRVAVAHLPSIIFRLTRTGEFKINDKMVCVLGVCITQIGRETASMNAVHFVLVIGKKVDHSQ